MTTTTFKYRGYPLSSYADPYPGRPDGERVMVACPECKGAARGRNCSGGCDHDGRVARAVRTLRNNAKVEAFARDYPGQPDPGKAAKPAAPAAKPAPPAKTKTKAGATLTENQRWLLLLMGGWAIIDALLSPAGTKHLMQSGWGGANHTPPEGAPRWLRSFDTRGSKIVAPCGVTVTAAQINRYAAALDDAIRAELAACQAARQTNTMQGYEWCHCPYQHTAPNAFTGPCTRYHPTEEDEAAHLAEYRRIGEWEKDLLRRALGL